MFLDAVCHLGHFRKQDGSAVALTDHHGLEPVNDLGFAGNPQGILRTVSVEAAERGIDVFGPKAADDLIHAHAEGFEPARDGY